MLKRLRGRILSINPDEHGKYQLIPVGSRAGIYQMLNDVFFAEPGSVEGFPDYGAGLGNLIGKDISFDDAERLRMLVFQTISSDDIPLRISDVEDVCVCPRNDAGVVLKIKLKGFAEPFVFPQDEEVS